MQNQHTGQTIKYKSLLQGVYTILREEGTGGLTKGLSASMMRELTYSSIRIGLYEPLRTFFATSLGHDPRDTTPIIKYITGLCSGATGAAIANPFDLIKTRFQAVMPHERAPYSSTRAAILSIYRLEGVQGLYKGWQVTTTRAAVLTSAQIGSYDSIKNNLLVKRLGMKDGFALHLCSSMMAGLITTTATNPGVNLR